MYNTKLIPLLFTFFFIHLINAFVTTKNEVLKIDNTSLKDKKCPEGSIGFIDKFCDFHFFCRNNTCATIPVRDEFEVNYLIEFPDEYNQMKKLKIKGSCSNNSECFSNNCINNICINKENISECLFITGMNKMHCGKINSEYCKNNEECASNICSSYNQCINEKNVLNDNDGGTIIIAVVSAIIVALLFCSGIIVCCCSKRKNSDIDYL
ncbi:hypothetical protein PIROE2DRAFT_5722 [Piromyces sp. E2]|nr:hypothetical protein PIROE2DRAFT_5722 [Piromyces sp. E2]|eukprot:OUM66980.1 hypothetical protein PIROE2DRAFT_5722 [Piromyces sp. E2]